VFDMLTRLKSVVYLPGDFVCKKVRTRLLMCEGVPELQPALTPCVCMCVSGRDRQGDVHHQAGGGSGGGWPRPADGICHHQSRLGVR